MAISVDVGTFNLRTTTGTTATSISLGGATPEFLMIWCPFQTATGINGGYAFSVGFSDGTRDRCTSMVAQDALAFGRAKRDSRNEILALRDVANTRSVTYKLKVLLDSFDADGFTLNYTANSEATAHKAHYLAIAGADLTNVNVGNFSGPTVTGDLSVTGVGFEPDCIILLDPLRIAAHPGGDTNANMGISFATPTSSASMHVQARNQSFPNTAQRILRDATVISGLDDTGVLTSEATFVRMDADGFTLNWSNLFGQPHIMYAALKGGGYDAGTDVSRTDPGTRATSVSGGLTPKAVLLGSVNTGINATPTAHARFSFGASDNTSELSVWEGFQSGVTTSSADTQVDETHCILITDLDNPPAAQSSAAVSAFAAGSFTLNWDVTDGVGNKEFMYLAIGDTGSPGGAPQLLNLSGSGIAPNEALGTPTFTTGVATVSVAGIGPNEALGLPAPVPVGVTTVSITGIGPNEALGLPQLNHILSVSGIGPNEALGSPAFTTGVATVSVTGILPNEALGSPTFVVLGADQTVGVAGIFPNEALGSPTFTTGGVSVSITGIAPNEALGSPTLNHILVVSGIAPNEALGSPTFTTGLVSVSITGIGPNEAIGLPGLTLGTAVTFKGYLQDLLLPGSVGKLFTLDTTKYPTTAQYFFRFYIRTEAGPAFPVVARVALLSGASTFVPVASSEVQTDESDDLDEVITAVAIGVSAGSNQYRIEYGGSVGEGYECAGGGFIVRSA